MCDAACTMDLNQTGEVRTSCAAAAWGGRQFKYVYEELRFI